MEKISLILSACMLSSAFICALIGRHYMKKGYYEARKKGFKGSFFTYFHTENGYDRPWKWIYFPREMPRKYWKYMWIPHCFMALFLGASILGAVYEFITK